MDSVFITTRKQRIIRELRDYMLIALGMLMYAIGWTVFLLPNDLPSQNNQRKYQQCSVYSQIGVLNRQTGSPINNRSNTWHRTRRKVIR